jgi:hypothetical protein
MIMADVLKIVFLVVGTLIVLVSYWLAAAALFPRTVARARVAYTERPVRATLLGAAVGGPSVLVGLALLNAPNGAAKLLGAVVVSTQILLGLLGSAGLGERIGAGLPSAGDAGRPWRAVLRGGIVLSLTFLFPIIGWFGVLPWALTSGVGAALMAMRAFPRLSALGSRQTEAVAESREPRAESSTVSPAAAA